jgi:hypothetical protein
LLKNIVASPLGKDVAPDKSLSGILCLEKVALTIFQQMRVEFRKTGKCSHINITLFRDILLYIACPKIYGDSAGKETVKYLFSYIPWSIQIIFETQGVFIP